MWAQKPRGDEQPYSAKCFEHLQIFKFH